EPSSWRTRMSGGRARSSVPLGPFTVTRPSARVTSTPDGSAMGVRPTRDMSPPLPHVAEDLTADAALSRLAVGHEALACGQDGDAESSEDPGQAIGTRVDTQAGLGDSAQP